MLIIRYTDEGDEQEAIKELEDQLDKKDERFRQMGVYFKEDRKEMLEREFQRLKNEKRRK